MNAALQYRLFTRPYLLRPIFAQLRRFAPILPLGKFVFVTRYLDVIEVLERDGDFTVAELNGPNIDRLDGPFVLGLDRGPQYEQESGLLHDVVRREDLPRITDLVKETAAEHIAAAWPERRIDVVNGFARATALRVVSNYFGIPEDPQRKLSGWLRAIFWDIFVNFTGDETVRARARASSAEFKEYLTGLIETREREDRLCLKDDVLGRMLALKGRRAWLDNATIRRNITGLAAGTVDNTSLFFARAVAQLLRRPEQLARARDAALNADTESVGRYVYEAARFDPAAPLLARYAARDVVLAAGTPRARLIRGGSTVILGNLSALFDPDGFDDPATFDIDHDAGRLHFGYGLHRCLGYYINGVQLAELGSTLFALSNLRRSPSDAGAMRFEGPFPDRLLVEFG